MIQKLHKIVRLDVGHADIPNREIFAINNAKSNAMMVLYKLLEEADIEPDDRLTVDVRILVERH